MLLSFVLAAFGIITTKWFGSHSHDQMAVRCPIWAGTLGLDDVFLSTAGHCHGDFTLMHKRTPVSATKQQ